MSNLMSHGRSVGSNRRCGFALPLLVLLSFGLSDLSYAETDTSSPATSRPPAANAPGEAMAPQAEAGSPPSIEATNEPEVEPEPSEKPAVEPAGRMSSEPPESADADLPPMPEPELSWGERVTRRLEALHVGAATIEDVDALFLEVDSELWPFQSEVYRELRRRSPKALVHREELEKMYDARMALFAEASPELRERYLGGSETGMRELKNELAYARLVFMFQALTIPRGIELAIADIRNSPLDDFWTFLQLVFCVAVFRSWRGWAPGGLAAARTRVLALRPRRRFQLRSAKLLWYLSRTRKPLEWLALLIIVFAIVDTSELEEVSILFWVVVLWLLLARLGVLIIDAVAVRGIARPGSKDSGLRLRSLRVSAAWLVLLGLGRDLATQYASEGAIHAWVWRVQMLASFPVLLMLLHWWRPEIFSRLERDAGHSQLVPRITAHRTGVRGYLHAAIGAGFLVTTSVLRKVVREAAQYEIGRNAVGVLLRREVARDVLREDREDEGPIPDELMTRLTAPISDSIEAPTRKAVQELVALAEAGRGGPVVVLAERGGGMSSFLSLLAKDVGDSMRIVDCPPGGSERFREALCDALGLENPSRLEEEIGPRVEALGLTVIAVDNFHNLPRPRMGGLEPLDRVSKMVEPCAPHILWVLGTNRNAWPYVERARADRAIVQGVIELPPWSDAKLQELMDGRAKAAAIDPDYSRLVFPRQFDDGERNTLEQRNRSGFRRVIGELSGGNPMVALHLFAESLRVLPDGRHVLRLPQPQSANAVSDASHLTLLVLKVIIQCDLATIEDLVECLRTPTESVVTAINFCLQNEFIELVEGRFYRVASVWFRAITLVLVRQNLLSR